MVNYNLISHTIPPITTALGRTLFLTRGGGGSDELSPMVLTNVTNCIGGSTEESSFAICPELHSTILMAIAMAFHYFGYSLARPTTLSLFTSSKIGFTNPSAFPLAMAFISPASLLLLMGYSRELDLYGPKKALLHSTTFCSSILILCSFLISYLQKQPAQIPIPILPKTKIPLVNLIVGILFIFRESYVQLLTSQMWSFMASVCTPTQSTQWFSRISALTSVSSVTAGLLVSVGIEKFGLTGVIACAGVALIASVFCSQAAYTVAAKHGFDPSKEHLQKKAQSKQQEHSENIIIKAKNLFSRVPTLAALFCEVITCQGLATLINVCFVTKLNEDLPDDGLRAGWTGKFFALINVISSILQIVVLPPLISVIEPSWVWRALPTIITAILVNQSLQVKPSLYSVSFSLLTMKALEFSARRMLDEMVYVPLDYESRYVGKEVISVFGYRFGKSLTSLLLSALTGCVGRDFGLQELSWITTTASAVWLGCSFRLSNLVLTRKEADEVYKKNRGV